MKTRALTALALLALSACASETPTSGELSRVDFQYDGSCSTPCSLETPLMTGSTQRVDMSGPGDAAGIRVTSTAPSTVAVELERHCTCTTHGDGWVEARSVGLDESCEPASTKRCDNTLTLTALASGSGTLELWDSGGALIDRVEVEVRDPHALTLERAGKPIDALSLDVDHAAAVEVVAYADDGRQLVARDGFAWSVDDAHVVGFPVGWDTAASPEHTRSAASLIGVGGGQAVVRVQAGAVSGTVTARVD